MFGTVTTTSLASPTKKGIEATYILLPALATLMKTAFHSFTGGGESPTPHPMREREIADLGPSTESPPQVDGKSGNDESHQEEESINPLLLVLAGAVIATAISVFRSEKKSTTIKDQYYYVPVEPRDEDPYPSANAYPYYYSQPNLPAPLPQPSYEGIHPAHWDQLRAVMAAS